MSAFHAHTHPDASSDALWGWLTRDPDPTGEPVAFWVGTPPEPGCAPGAWVQWDVVHGFSDDGDIWFRRAGYRIMGGDGCYVLTCIPDEDTARELLAWLCPSPQK